MNEPGMGQEPRRGHYHGRARSLERCSGLGGYNNLGGGGSREGTKGSSLRGCRSMGVRGGRSI